MRANNDYAQFSQPVWVWRGERKRVEPRRKSGVQEWDFLRIGVIRACSDADQKNPLRREQNEAREGGIFGDIPFLRRLESMAWGRELTFQEGGTSLSFCQEGSAENGFRCWYRYRSDCGCRWQKFPPEGLCFFCEVWTKTPGTREGWDRG